MTVVESNLLRRQAYIDGCWVDADSGETFRVPGDRSEWLELKYLALGGLG